MIIFDTGKRSAEDFQWIRTPRTRSKSDKNKSQNLKSHVPVRNIIKVVSETRSTYDFYLQNYFRNLKTQDQKIIKSESVLNIKNKTDNLPKIIIVKTHKRKKKTPDMSPKQKVPLHIQKQSRNSLQVSRLKSKRMCQDGLISPQLFTPLLFNWNRPI